MTNKTGPPDSKKTMNGYQKWINQGVAVAFGVCVCVFGIYPMFEDYRSQNKTLTDQVPKMTGAVEKVAEATEAIQASLEERCKEHDQMMDKLDEISP